MVLTKDMIRLTEIEIKLSINKRLFEDNHITEEMYKRAKNIFIRQTQLIKHENSNRINNKGRTTAQT